MRQAITIIVIFVLILTIFAAIFVWSGAYNIAATEPHWEITSSVIGVMRDRSIVVHSAGGNPPALTDPDLIKQAIPRFHETCRLCHGAPGHSIEEFAQGLYPSAPSLSSGELQKEWNSAQLFWIVRNGIKLTGMPAFGATFEDKELWGIVAFLERLPSMKVDEYNAQLGPAGSGQ